VAVSDTVSSLVVDVSGAGSMGPTARPGRLARRVRGRPWLVPLLPIGVALLLVGAQARSLPDLVQWGCALAGALSFVAGFEALGRLWRGPGFDTGFWLAAIWIGLVVVAAVVADLLPLAESRDASKALTEPIIQRPDLFSRHPFGTDRQGLDILGGVIYGARISLEVSLGAVAIGLTIGGIVGVIAGFFRGRTDNVASLLVDSLLAFPPLILLLAVVSAVRPNARNIAFALAIITIPTLVRLARANTLTLAQREFVLSARAMGATNRRIVFRELLPNVVRPLISYAFLIVAVLIVAEASLSFLGVGIQRPTPTWGNMIAAGQETFDQDPHLVFVPGTVMFFTVFAINRVGDRARRLWDTDRRTM
jgi:peptide/nickel transport system permease protein